MFPLLYRVLESFAGSAEHVPVRRISDAFPDVSVTNQFGRELRFRKDLMAGQGALIINTMFTTCRGSCPGTSASIASLRESIFPTFGKRVTFLSLTLEPFVDTPKKLLSYSKVYGADKIVDDLGDWHFLTMSPADLDQLRRSLGFFELNPEVDRDINQHASTLLVGNLKSDRWSRFPATLRNSVLIDSIRRIAGNTIEEKFGIPA